MRQNLKIVIKYFISALFVFFVIPLHAQEKVIKINTDVLVVGGTASGISAGIQSARMGVNTMVVESTSWLGGMLTSAGVPAFDGNHLLPSGIFGEFIDQLHKVYGGPNKVATGWVSNTLFEPHVGDSIFKAIAASENKLIIKYHNLSTPYDDLLKSYADGDSRIILINTELPRSVLISLMKKIHCFVSLHRAEGFGRLLATQQHRRRQFRSCGYVQSRLLAIPMLARRSLPNSRER
jgi:hypothetical protein